MQDAYLWSASSWMSPFGIFGPIRLTGSKGELIDWLFKLASPSSSSTVVVCFSTAEGGGFASSSSSSSSEPDNSSSSEMEGNVQTRVFGLLAASWREGVIGVSKVYWTVKCKTLKYWSWEIGNQKTWSSRGFSSKLLELHMNINRVTIVFD